MSNIHGLNTDDDKPPRRGDGGSSGNESDNDDEGRQGFFVGGSERSGQQVLGPNQNDHQNRIFDAIRRAGAEQMTPEQMEEMERQKQQRGGTSAWGGGGFRLGGHGIASEPVGSSAANSAGNSTANGPAQRPQQVVRMFIWRNGFSIDDGPLRQFEDNRAFMDALMKKRIPPELNALYPGKEIDLRIERKAEDYVPPKPKPFSGQGHRLGSHVPNVVGVGNSSAAATGVDIVDLEPTPPLKPPSDSLVEEAQKNVQLNEQQPITRIQIRFPDLPQPIVARFNHTATLDQLRAFIVTVQPTLAYRPFHLQTIYPHKLVEDESQSLEEAKLINAAVTLKFDD